MSKASLILAMALGAVWLVPLYAEEPPAGKTEPSAGKIAYGDTAPFWESYALIVAKVIHVKHYDDELNIVGSDVKFAVLQSVPNRYKEGTEFSLTYKINLQFRPIRDRPGYAIDLGVDDRVMLMITEKKGKLIDATPRLNLPAGWDPLGAIDLKLGGKPINLEIAFRGITTYAMMPAWKLKFPQDDDALVAETVRVCQALSESNASRRLARIGAILKEKPSGRVRELMHRRLQTTLADSLHDAQEAARLLNPAPKM